jgi:hypothetical protein
MAGLQAAEGTRTATARCLVEEQLKHYPRRSSGIVRRGWLRDRGGQRWRRERRRSTRVQPLARAGHRAEAELRAQSRARGGGGGVQPVRPEQPTVSSEHVQPSPTVTSEHAQPWLDGEPKHHDRKGEVAMTL